MVPSGQRNGLPPLPASLISFQTERARQGPVMKCENPRCDKELGADRRSHARHCDAVCRAQARRAKIRDAVADLGAHIAAHGTAEQAEAFRTMTATASVAEAIGRAVLAERGQ